jgi:hypothetical protein
MEAYIKFCPICKSTDIDEDRSAAAAFGIPPQMTCRNCGKTAYNFPEVAASQIDELKKEAKKQ